MANPEHVLAWNRSDANRRDTRLLLFLFGLIILPVVFYVGQYLTFVVALPMLSVPGVAEEAAIDPIRILIIAAASAVAILIVVLALEYRYAARLVLRITGARPVTSDQEPELWRVVENLCIGTGLPHPGVYVIESEATNSLSTGLDPESASIVLTRGLLDLLERRELEGVVAQELVQIGNRDTRLKTVVTALVATLWLPTRLVYRFFRFLFGFHWVVGVGCLVWLGFPLLGGFIFALGVGFQELRTDPMLGTILLGAMFLPIYAFLLAPLAGVGIRAVLSRERELLADSDAVLLTRNSGGLLGALTKVRDEGSAELPVNPAVAHLFLVDPRPGEEAARTGFRRTHPPLDERIDLLQRMGGSSG